MSNGRYSNVVRAFHAAPWAIEEDKFWQIHAILTERANGARLTDDEIQARVGGQAARRDAVMAGNVAILPLYGVIAPRADAFTEMSGGTSVQRFRDAFHQALGDKSVGAIVLDVDSPGGQVDQIPEMAAEIRAARGKKPIVAVANTGMNSAAYWLASQADEVVATPSALVGSIGVFAAHNDISKAQEMDGVKTTLVSAGKFKVENSPFEPLSDEARGAIQSRVDDSYQMFTLDVSKGRRVTVDQVRSGFGEGRTLPARAALKEGMVDRIGTLDETVARVAATFATKNGSVAVSFTGSAANLSAAFANAPPGTVLLSDATAAASGLFYAPIGATIAEEGASIGAAALDYIDRVASLGEARKGALSGAKREALVSFETALREAADRSQELLAATDPDKTRKDGQHALAALALLATT